ncbi:MAG: type VI secretion system protein VasD [Paraglaciecola sp.]|jgi:type VI secretion system protein VasD
MLTGILKLPILRYMTLGSVLLLLSGCGATNLVKDVYSTITNADITLRAEANINPDIDGRPSPVLVRIYELKSATAFNNADFFALYDRDVAELAADFVKRDDLELKPLQVIELSRELAPETRYLGIIAAFRSINDAKWKQVIEIEPDSNSTLLIELSENDIKVTQQ